MIVVINSVCSSIPKKFEPLTTRGDALLNFLVCLGYDPMDPPMADLLRSYHGLEGEWLIVSPVHWEATHNDAQIIATAKDAGLADAESELWFKRYADFLAEDGLSLFYHDSETWLLCVDNKPSLSARPVRVLINKSLMPELAQLDKSMFWQKFITESQMFFASRPNNTPLNGVWLWGGSQLLKNSISVCADKHWYPLVTSCQNEVTQYDPSLSLKEYQLVLLEDLDSLSEAHQIELKKRALTWYWNNLAFRPCCNYFVHLWRTIVHAY